MNEKSKEKTWRTQLIKHLLTASDFETMENTLNSLLTPAEFSEISKRLQIFERLEAGIPQRQIAEELGVGIATVTRGSRARQQSAS